MIPQVKSWIVVDLETGERWELDTINKRMVTIIMRLDYPRTWGHSLKITLDRRTPDQKRQEQLATYEGYKLSGYSPQGPVTISEP